MSADLAAALGWGQALLLVGFAVFLRVGAAMALLPAFGERSVPLRVRLALTLAFTLVVAPAVEPTVAPALAVRGGWFLLSETVSGLALGAVIRLFVLALQTAGTMAAQSTSLSQIFGGATADPQPAMGHVLLIGGLALAVMTGLHVRLAELLIASYDLLPPGQVPDAQVMAEWGLGHVSRTFALAFTLAAPFVIASLVYNVALGVINRAMPQLMVAFVGAPAITAGGLILLAVAAPYLLSAWLSALNGFLANPFGAG